jgi:dipeptidyl aminopeptidase/acylaminoacyl peptidase
MSTTARQGGDRNVQVPTGGLTLEGELNVPAGAQGIILFAHGSASSRHSPRNRFVAQQLRAGGLGTLLLDLLTMQEEALDLQTAELRFNVELLADRLAGATDWLVRQPLAQGTRFGYFGASTGAAAALLAAAERQDLVAAVVSRGGRPDLAERVLARVRTPTLLIVGGNDFPIISANREALACFGGERGLAVVPGATHLLEEPGALEQVARLALDWFIRYLGRQGEQRAFSLG